MYMTLAEIRRHRGRIRATFEDLLRRPSFVQRATSRQWIFFRACLERLLGAETKMSLVSRQQAVQYKFEIQDRLRRFYLSEGKPIAYVFQIVDQNRALSTDLIDDSYPSLAGYVLLVGPARPELFPHGKSRELREYVESVVVNAAVAEFTTYKRLPNVDTSPLEPYFVPSGPAFKRIENILRQHSRKKRTIQSPDQNPSHMLVKKVKMLEASRDHAVVRTQEYWYLRWWSLPEERYVNIYDQQNYQLYSLVKRKGRWLVETNEYPQPTNRARGRKPSNGSSAGRQASPGAKRLGPPQGHGH